MGKIKDFPKQKMADVLQAKKQMQSLPIPALISTINSRWHQMLTDVDGDAIFQKLKQEADKI